MTWTLKVPLCLNAEHLCAAGAPGEGSDQPSGQHVQPGAPPLERSQQQQRYLLHLGSLLRPWHVSICFGCQTLVVGGPSNCHPFCRLLFRLAELANSDDSGLARSVSVATGLNNIVKRPRVRTIFPHAAGNNNTLLSFDEGDVILLLIPDERDGWMYGELEKNGK